MAPKTGMGALSREPRIDRELLSPGGGAEDAKLVRVLGVSAPIPVAGRPEQRVALIASSQRGRVTRQQLRDAGLGDSVIDRLVRNGSLHRFHRSVYVVGHLAELPLGEETAVILACRAGAALSHASAAALWRLAPTTGMPRPVEVTVHEGTSVRVAGVRWHRSRTLLARDVRVREYLPVTSPAWTLADMAGTSTPRELELALDEGLRNEMVSLAQIREVLGRAWNRAGVGTLRRLVSEGRTTTVTRSQAEERLLALIRKATLPPPEVNAWLAGLMVDFLWRRERIVVEVDGFAFHGSRRRFEDDRSRGAQLAAAGFQVIRITWRQMQDEPYAVIARLAQALARAQSGAA